MNYHHGWYIDVKYHTLKIPTTRCEGFLIDLKVPSNYTTRSLTYHYTLWNGSNMSLHTMEWSSPCPLRWPLNKVPHLGEPSDALNIIGKD
jgi:hypothetical protein